MKEDDVKKYLEDFKKADINKKLDLWFYAMEQDAIWDEIMEEMSKLARVALMKSGVKPTITEEK
ncbi:MAG: hypothetical protein KAS76_04095 [Thermoplasmatales archaeon]|nr:hypothetical protein [Thermoplasmatales archaeon]MCK5636796.1 hypothetical protein [Thermoplasmatales archaeon]